MWRARSLASQILLGVLGILVVTMTLGGFLYIQLSARTLDRQYEQRALGIANTVAQMDDIKTALLHRDPTGEIQTLAQRIRAAAGAAYVVVTDRNGVRYSHPDPRLIGRRLEEGVTVLDGRGHVGIDNGVLGRSANGRAPIRSASGRLIGEVSVGILETTVLDREKHEFITIGVYSAMALGFGMLASLILARRIKQVTFGLELSEIATLLQEREAMLHGIREGMVGFDNRGCVTVINAEAQRLLQVGPGVVGQSATDVVGPGRLRSLLTGEIEGVDQVAVTDDFMLVVNRMPVELAGRRVGHVVTLRDRTEFEALVRELQSLSGLTTALRAQEHEFANRLHVIHGLLELGEPAEASTFVAELSATALSRADDLRARVAPPVVAALLLAKITIAAEQGVRLEVTADSHLDQPTVDPQTLVTTVGNLVDNAIEALAGRTAPREVTVHFSDRDRVSIVVTDNGPGVSADAVERVFLDGYSTKATAEGARRGLGLALVHRIVHRSGGTITASAGPGGHFEVTLPIPARARDLATAPTTGSA